MPLLLDATTTNTGGGAGTSNSFSHTVGASGRYRALFVLVSLRGSGGMPSSLACTYGGVSMTSLGSVTDATTDIVVAAFRLVNPATGANTVAVSWTGNAYYSATARSYFNVNSGMPVFSGSYTTLAATTSAPSMSVGASGGDIVLDLITKADTFGETLTVGAGQTQIQNAGVGTQFISAISFEAAAASGAVTMSWSKSGSGDRLVGLSFAVHGSSGAQQPAISPMMSF